MPVNGLFFVGQLRNFQADRSKIKVGGKGLMAISAISRTSEFSQSDSGPYVSAGALSTSKPPHGEDRCELLMLTGIASTVTGLTGAGVWYLDEQLPRKDRTSLGPWMTVGGIPTAIGSFYLFRTKCGPFDGGSPNDFLVDPAHPLNLLNLASPLKPANPGDPFKPFLQSDGIGSNERIDPGESLGTWEKVGWGALGVLALIGAGVLVLSPFEGPVGEIALGTAAAALFAKAGLSSRVAGS